MTDETIHDAVIQRTNQTLGAIYGDKSWLTAEPIVQAATARAESVRRLGAREVMALGAVWGSGNAESETPHICLDGAQVSGLMASLRAGEAALDAPSEPARERIDEWDPLEKARVIRALFSEGRPIAGRRAWGRRRAEWLALEDKTAIDALWDDVGIVRAPSTTIPADEGALFAAHRTHDRGWGTVWAADNREGWHGGASGVRWVHDGTTLDSATTWMRAHADHVRVMPFLQGIPCSIHGLVFPDYVVALRPCEMLVLREQARGRFHYAQAATTWDPPAQRRAAMRDAARRTGTYLQRRYGYRGAFTIDGILTSEGFLPTELNPRFGAALGLIGRAVPDLDLYLLHLALIEGVEHTWEPLELEEALLHFADHDRQAQVSLLTPLELSDGRTSPLVRAGDGSWQVASSRESSTVFVSAGPAPGGAMIRLAFSLDPSHRGRSLAPDVAEILATIDTHWQLGLPTYTPAQPAAS